MEGECGRRCSIRACTGAEKSGLATEPSTDALSAPASEPDAETELGPECWLGPAGAPSHSSSVAASGGGAGLV